MGKIGKTFVGNQPVTTVAEGGTGISTVTGLVKGNGTAAMSAATANTDYVTPAYSQNATFITLTSVSGTDTITATAPSPFTALVDGQEFSFISAGANAGTSVTLNISSTGAIALKKSGGTALAIGDIPAAGAFVKVKYVASGPRFEALGISAAASSEPSGTIVMWGGSSIPSGWLQVPTAATNISRTTYAGIFAAYGTTWGVGDGSTTFGMPYCPTGQVFVQGTIASTTNGQMPAHTHALIGYGTGSNTGTGTNSVSVAGSALGNTGSTGSGTANLPAGVGINYIIKI